MTAAGTARPHDADVVVLRSAGVALVLDCRGPQVPRVLHWGCDVGPLDGSAAAALRAAATPPVRPSGFDQATWLTLLPGEADGWLGAPALTGHRDGRALVPRLSVLGIDVDHGPSGGASVLAVRAADEDAGVAVNSELRLEPAGLLRVRHEVINTGADRLDLAAVAVTMPVPSRAAEVLDLTGRWGRESAPQRNRLDQATRLRETRHGRTGHDTPLLMVVGTEGFGFRHGEVWAMHVAWSGDATWRAERSANPPANASAALIGGELLRPGEVRLAPAESYATPWVCFSHAADGLDAASARIHGWLRSRPEHPATPRPVVLNTWEAVYFDHDVDRLRALADVAAQVGVERFVLDDGWFRGRRHDRAGLGDWYVDEGVWPQGLHPLVDHVRGLGLQVGLWVEPEMINLDSDLAREHPDWLLAAPGRLPLEWRTQQVLDLSRDEVSAYVLERLDALVSTYGLDFLKWDHNRDLAEAVHAPTGQAGVHGQTLALYALLDALRARHPRLEIESCASGGARVDLGILQRTDRVWASDTNDALERQQIQRWTGLLVPPEMIGSHVGGPVSHTTGRVVGLRLRTITSLFAHMGFEWDLTTCTSAERAELADWVRLHKELRPLLHSGTVVRGDLEDPGALLHGVVGPDGRSGVYAHVRLATATAASPGRVLLPGLDGDRAYDVRLRGAGHTGPHHLDGRPGWWVGPDAAHDAVLAGVPGAVLETVGIQLPTLHPGEATLVHVTAHGPE